MTKSARLAVAAATLAACCGMAAFVSLVLRDHSHPKVMVNEQSAPQLARERSSPAPAPLTAPASTKEAARAGPSTSAADQNGGKHTFNMNKSTELSIAGSMRLKLVKTEPAKKLYDMRVISGRRWYTHRHLKLNEPLWVAVDKQTALEVVVSSIDSGAVGGYWMETSRSAQVSSKVHAKHPRTE